MQIITNQFHKELKKHGSDQFPFLVSYERLSKYESGSFMWHWHPEIEITVIQKGNMCYKVNHCVYHLKEGDVLFGNSNVLHTGSMENMQDCEYISITFDTKMIYGFFQSIICSKYVEPIIQDFSLPAILFDGSQVWHENFIVLIWDIIKVYHNKPLFYEFDLTIKIQTMWKMLLENYSSNRQQIALNKSEHERIKRIITFIEQNYMNKFTLNDVALHIHLCESECCRLFKRYMNVSLFSFLQEYRIERSLEYLNCQESISEIAGKVGFSDSNYYSKVFAKIKGCSPQKYRKKMRNNL